MRNLAGSKDSDIWTAAELTAAGIPIEIVEKPYGEPETRVKGRLGSIEFSRAWYYWVAKGRVPLDVARRLYADPVGQKAVRVAGHCGCPPPERPWVTYYDGDERVCVDPDGKKEADFDEYIKTGALTAANKPRFAKSAAGLAAFVESYHIDSAEGLRLFADAIREMRATVPDDVTEADLRLRLEAALTWIEVHKSESKEIDQIRREWFESGVRQGRREAVRDVVAMLRKEHAAGSFGTPDFWAHIIEEKFK